MAAKYRKISPSIWNDAKFRNLSEQAKLVFFLLLTHPHTSAIGTIRAYQEGLACEMQWSAKQFRERFAELSSKGMVKVDETAGLIWLPNFMKHNMPENPNMLKSWKGSFDECPECCLKSEVFQACKLLAEQLGKGFKKAFDDCLSNGIPNQEQEQEQEQEQNIILADSSEADCPPDESPVVFEIPIIVKLGDKNRSPVFDVRQNLVDEFTETYPAVNVMFEIRKAITWCNSNPKNKKTRDGVKRFLNSWLAKAQNQAMRIPEVTDPRARAGRAIN